MYKLKYPAPGAPELAKRVKELLTASGFKDVEEDRETEKDVTYHYSMGKALAPPKKEGVLIFGSGNVMRLIFAHRYEDVNHYEEKAPPAKMIHPRIDHFYPLHVAIGAAGENSKANGFSFLHFLQVCNNHLIPMSMPLC
ncbi:hypothetical protein Pint_27577 [Pistacia integerrima]|uniref:Uncharacterized protein n=1 Tax=Pistacia integerrima TaxID=434235 RepID=A0ACC0YQZ0_9ROSI|nr:hypothetical protein Pint_27577 [Pistacia integerrima]